VRSSSAPAWHTAPVARPISGTRVETSVLWAFGAPTLGVGFLIVLLQIYYLKFATDALLLAPATMGVIFGLSRLWDAISDPLVGYWSDRTRSRWGRRRPWIAASVLPLLLCAYALWSPPAAMSGASLSAWVAISLFGFFTAYTLFSVPHVSLGAELSAEPHERSRVFAAREIADKSSLFLAMGALIALERGGDMRTTAGWLVVLSAPLLIATTWGCVRNVRERPDYAGRGPERPFAAARDVLHNPHARRLLVIVGLEQLGFGALGSLMPYASEYVFRTPGYTAYYVAAFVVPILASIPLWLKIARRFGKTRTWLAGLSLKAVALTSFFLLQVESLPVIFGCIVLIGTGQGCGSLLALSLQADVVDFDELRTAERKEGAYFAAWTLVMKGATAVAIAVAGVGLQLAGFEPGVEQTGRVEWTLRWLIAGAPALLTIAAAFVLWGFEFDEAHRRARKLLDEGARS
jgi:GPH family glycoside/pentoside/hexuronide:cation symporter